MKKILIISVLLCITVNLSAQKYNHNYIGEPIAKALIDFCKTHPDIRINFIYDELENYKVRGKINSDNPLQAVKQLIAFNPISVTSDDSNHIYLETLQKGKYNFTGRTVSTGGEPVCFATVMLLNPKDSTAITYGITDERGYFSIPCDRRNVLAKFSSIGYKTKTIRANDFSLGNITMDIQVIDLKTATATSDSRYALNDRTIYIPSNREKNAAQGGSDLLQFMAIPSININPLNKGITTLSGQQVVAFIDYVKASDRDIENLRPQDVKKVEVLDYPADPRFEGVLHAINFIMDKYEYGGYTKLSDQQILSFKYGYYSLSSKFSYGKMTYDLYTGYDHWRSNREGISSTSFYDFNGNEIERRQNTPESENENNEAYLSARAKYQTEKAMVSNQISIRHNDVPKSNSVFINSYIPPVYAESEAYRIGRRNTLNPSWRGNYQFTLPHALRLVVTPSAAYARNKSYTFFSEDNTDILNNVKEDTWSANLGASLSKNWNKHTVNVSLNGEFSDDKLRYEGTNPARIHYTSAAAGAHASGNLSFGKFWLQPSAKLYFSRTQFDNVHYNQLLPGYYIAAGVNFNRKNQMSISSEMSNWTIGVSRRSPNIVVQNMLDAVKGNPNLKTWLYNSVNIDYTWLPLQGLNFSAYGNFIRHTKPMDFTFTPTMIDGREMMLRSYIKDGYFQELSAGLSVVSRLFKNSLTLRGYAGFYAYRRGGIRKYTRNVVNSSISAVYYLGKFYFRASYDFPTKTASSYYIRSDNPSYYQFSAGWGNKGWNVSAIFRNPFRSNWEKMSSFTSYHNYTAYETNYGSAYRRQFWITATYTISYGKKISNDGIDRGKSVSSGIVN